MSNAFGNVTAVLLVQNAIGLILEKIGEEINAHATCIITDANSHNNEIHLNHLPAVRGDCQTGDTNVFIKHVQHGVAIGCSLFVVCATCSELFLNEFHHIHDGVDQKYEKKVLVLLDTQKALEYPNAMDILTHKIVINDIPLTLLIQPNANNEWICVWSAYPYDLYSMTQNRLFLGNLSFEFDKQIIPKILDLNGLSVTGAFFNYPPYSSYKRVANGTGNAELFGSSACRPIHLDGQENIILLEFCVKYNCTLTARLEYDDVFWGEAFDNQTGVGMIGALAMREANVSVAAMYLWQSPYKYTQYSTIIQRATATNIVPKPLPLPYWQTPILPFPAHIWNCVMGSLLIGASALFIVNFLLSKIIRPNAGGHESMGLFDSFFAIFKISVFQGVRLDINFLTNFVILAVMLIFALIIGNLYAGGLSSVMTITRYESPINNVESLIHSKLSWGGTSWVWMDALKHSEYPAHKKLIQNYTIKSIDELRQLVRQRTTAVSVEVLQHGTLSYQSFLERETSKNYMLIKEPMYWEFTVVYSTTTWPFMEQLNRIILMQQESGIRYYWEYLSAARLMDYDIQRNLEKNGKILKAGAPVKLSADHILGALLLLLFGNVLATVFFCLEMLFNSQGRRVRLPKCLQVTRTVATEA